METIIHEATREYAYPVSRNRLLIKLKSAAKDRSVFFIHFCNRLHDKQYTSLKMECRRKDGEFNWFFAEISRDESVKYIRYFFESPAESESIYYGADGPETQKPRHCFEYLYTNESDVFKVPGWAEGAVFYQIFPERFFNADPSNDPPGTEEWGGKPTRTNFFGGDLKGITAKYDYISELGADCIYLTPIFKSPSNHKYDTEDYYAIDPSFGSMADLKNLVGLFHSRGIKVVLDGVFNHCGFNFQPFQDVLKNGKESEYVDWFYLDGIPVRTDPPGYECVGYYGLMPKLRFANRAVRNYFLDVGRYWIREAGIDGWRLDVADEVDFTFWQEFRRVIKTEKKDAILIGETWKDGRDLLRGDQMDSVMNYIFRDAVIDFFALGIIDSRQFDHRIQRLLSIYPDMVYPVLYNLTGSHDTSRTYTMCGGDPRRMKLAAAFQMSFPGMPAIYCGDELAMAGENDPDCRRTMDWENGDSGMLEVYRHLISLRKAIPALKHGDFNSIVCENGVYGFARRYGEETAYVILNNTDETKLLDIPLLSRSPVELLMEGQKKVPEVLCGTEKFYNGDILNYFSKFKMALPARCFEICWQKPGYETLNQGGI